MKRESHLSYRLVPVIGLDRLTGNGEMVNDRHHCIPKLIIESTHF
jgi:hypothetical protein